MLEIQILGVSKTWGQAKLEAKLRSVHEKKSAGANYASSRILIT
jgi:hypothetical protein